MLRDMGKKYKDQADIFDVANAAGVSTSTVSRTFNHPDLVRPQTRKRIAEAIKTTGYIRNRAAQTIHGRRSGTVGFIVPTIEHTIFAELVHAFSQTLEAEDYSIILSSHDYDLRREYHLLRKLLEHRVDGIALIGQMHRNETNQLLKIQKIPVVNIWNYSENSYFDCIGASNFEAGYVACKHLLDLGHEKIGLVFPDHFDNDRAEDRLNGAKTALTEAHGYGSEQFVKFSSYSVSRAKLDCMELLSQRKTSALLCGNDVIGRGALHAARELGITIPDEQSIMSIGDFKGSADFVPSLSTVRIPSEKIGRLSAEVLLKRILQPECAVERQKISLELLPRQSTCKWQQAY